MAPLYIRRVETVVSLAQLPDALADEPQQGDTPRAAPDARIAQVAHTRMAKYSFATTIPRVTRAAGQPQNESPLTQPQTATPALPASAASTAGADGGSGSDGEEGGALFGWDAVSKGTLLRGPQDPCIPGRSLLDGLLLALWEEAGGKSLLR